MKRVYAIEKWCVDCKRCEIACKTFHSQHRDYVKTYLFENDTAFSRIHVEGDETLSIAVNCRHCENPRCVEGCISGAMHQDPETGIVSVDADRCVGCRTCVVMCPYGCVTVNEIPNERGGEHAAPLIGRAFKCDLCSEDGVAGEPACVQACPNRALVYVESMPASDKAESRVSA